MFRSINLNAQSYKQSKVLLVLALNLFLPGSEHVVREWGCGQCPSLLVWSLFVHRGFCTSLCSGPGCKVGEAGVYSAVLSEEIVQNAPTFSHDPFICGLRIMGPVLRYFLHKFCTPMLCYTSINFWQSPFSF